MDSLQPPALSLNSWSKPVGPKLTFGPSHGHAMERLRDSPASLPQTPRGLRQATLLSRSPSSAIWGPRFAYRDVLNCSTNCAPRLPFQERHSSGKAFPTHAHAQSAHRLTPGSVSAGKSGHRACRSSKPQSGCPAQAGVKRGRGQTRRQSLWLS